MQIDNRTPFLAAAYAMNDFDGSDLLLAVLKATWSFEDVKKIEIAAEQESIVPEDRYAGAPESTSLLYASDLAIHKPAADIALGGCAYPERPGGAENLIGLRVGSWQKMGRVFGDRFWSLGNAPGRPAPFTKIPIVYEHAFGGRDTSHANPEQHDFEDRNPAGRGFRATRSQRPVAATPLPNFEHERQPMKSPHDRPAPFGLGFIPPSRKPRTAYAGTYDEAWSRQRMPLLPDDFDARYFLAVPPDQVYPGFLQGGERVDLVGVVPEGRTGFSLPRPSVACQVEGANAAPEIPLMWNRLWIDAERRRLVGVWTGTGPVHSFRKIKEITFSSEVN